MVRAQARHSEFSGEASRRLREGAVEANEIAASFT
jgi:hypothetical protein